MGTWFSKHFEILCFVHTFFFPIFGVYLNRSSREGRIAWGGVCWLDESNVGSIARKCPKKLFELKILIAKFKVGVTCMPKIYISRCNKIKKNLGLINSAWMKQLQLPFMTLLKHQTNKQNAHMKQKFKKFIRHMN